MGGDNAPDAIIKGTIKADQMFDELDLILVGKSDIINRKLKNFTITDNSNFKIKEASEVISMEETPATAIRKKKNSSINIGTRLIKNNQADAFISAGNTGAVMGASLFNIGRMTGIKRPSIATIFPSKNGKTMVLDAGANVDSKPTNLVQFAIMAQIYTKKIFNIKSPSIGLLNIGEEDKKGNKLAIETSNLLKNDSRINNFIGNVEGRDIFQGTCDIIVCDGFVGNIVLKTTEGAVSYLFKLFKKKKKKNLLTRAASLLIKPYLKQMKNKIDYRKYGGAPLLGVNGIVIISHGSSDATAIFNSIKVAKNTYEANVVNSIKKEIDKEGENNNDT